MDVYINHYRKLNRACLDLAFTGMRVDRGAWDSYREECEAKLRALRERLRELAGEDLVAKKGLARPRVNKFFYETLGCKPFVKRGTGRPTTDEVHVRKLMLKYKKAVPGGQALLEFAHYSKRRGWFGTKLTPDDRYLSAYKLTPITGRLASSKTPDDYGSNGQNADRKLRAVFVADPGQLIAKWDMSQIESRLVDGASGNKRALELARTPPWELDQHKLMASEVLEKPMEEVSAEEREVVGKRGRHAYNYGMEEYRMAEVLLVETESRVIRTPEECKDILTGVGRARPYIDDWQAWVRERILTEGKLVNSWGRHLLFPWRTFRLTKEDFKQGLAWGPQSDAGCLTNQNGILVARKAIRVEGLQATLIQQEHDALAASGTLDALWRLHEILRESLQAERTYPGRNGPWTLSVPAGLKLGRTLAGTVEWKRLPSRKQFMDAGKEMLCGS
jgi:DNA polymerase I-like protein with 3'-5' exonuclease and polymerase domains